MKAYEKLGQRNFFSNPLKIRRNAPVSDKVLGSTVQTHLISFTPVLKHWCFVGANKHRWIWVWLLWSVLLHHTPTVFPAALYYLWVSSYPSPLLAKTLENWLHTYSTVRPSSWPAEEIKKSSLSTEKLCLPLRKLSEDCSLNPYFKLPVSPRKRNSQGCSL